MAKGLACAAATTISVSKESRIWIYHIFVFEINNLKFLEDLSLPSVSSRLRDTYSRLFSLGTNKLSP